MPQVILSTHAIVGAAIASLIPDHPALAFPGGMANHFAIDSIPHWDYPLRAISVKPSTGATLRLNWFLFRDLGLITLDACVGLAIALWLYATPTAELSPCGCGLSASTVRCATKPHLRSNHRTYRQEALVQYQAKRLSRAVECPRRAPSMIRCRRERRS
jgi:hypothetical protein